VKAADVFPWTEPDSIYGSDGPLEEDSVEFTVNDVTMRVEDAHVLAPNTMRDRYRVTCVTCDKLIHRATTGSTTRCVDHLKEEHGIVIER
jgi:hypothetical protein